jgi:hypothetical protein
MDEAAAPTVQPVDFGCCKDGKNLVVLPRGMVVPMAATRKSNASSVVTAKVGLEEASSSGGLPALRLGPDYRVAARTGQTRV